MQRFNLPAPLKALDFVPSNHEQRKYRSHGSWIDWFATRWFKFRLLLNLMSLWRVCGPEQNGSRAHYRWGGWSGMKKRIENGGWRLLKKIYLEWVLRGLSLAPNHPLHSIRLSTLEFWTNAATSKKPWAWVTPQKLWATIQPKYTGLQIDKIAPLFPWP